MSEQQQQEYIITDLLLKRIMVIMYQDCEPDVDIVDSLIAEVHARPNTPAPASGPKEICDRCELEWLTCEINPEVCEQEEHDAAIARKAREQVLGLARDMYSLMMCVEKTNTDEFMEYYAERMKGLKEQYESLRQQEGEQHE